MDNVTIISIVLAVMAIASSVIIIISSKYQIKKFDKNCEEFKEMFKNIKTDIKC